MSTWILAYVLIDVDCMCMGVGVNIHAWRAGGGSPHIWRSILLENIRKGASSLPSFTLDNMPAASSAGNHGLARDDPPRSTYAVPCDTMAEGR